MKIKKWPNKRYARWQSSNAYLHLSNSKTFRRFISSTFNDFKEERQVLHEKVFPKITKYCIEKGYTFQPVDFRRGGGENEEAQLDQKP